MKTTLLNKNVLIIGLVIILTSMLVAGCTSQPSAASTPADSTLTDLPPQTTDTSTVPEATLPSIPTQAVVRPPSLGVLSSTPTVPDQRSGCTAPADPTPASTEGPNFKDGSPETGDLYQTGMPGTKLVLSGFVYTTDCKPVAHTLLDFWQPDTGGIYDNSGYTLRGHQYTDDNGHYQLTTIVPGPFPDRSEYIHVKVQAPNGPVLTTQLFFPDVQTNQFDSAYKPSLVMSVQQTADEQQAEFNFIVAP